MNSQYLEKIPRDISLELPAPEWLLVGLLIISFIFHIIFVNLMVGGSLLTTIFEFKGLTDKRFDKLARLISKTITVNKSMAVVLGVGPLLTINALYTVYFYTANALTGAVWIAVIPLVTIAFLLTYLHKYSWDALENNKLLHVSISVGASLIFLFIPLIFLSNVTTMILPERWEMVDGFLSTLSFPGIIPRYMLFLSASISLTSLFIIWVIKNKKFNVPKDNFGFTEGELLNIFFSLSLLTIVSQFLIAPFLYFDLPAHGKSLCLNLLIFTAVLFLIGATINLIRAVKNIDSYRYFKSIVSFILISIICMSIARHIYREDTLSWHKKLLKEKTELWSQKVKEAKNELKQVTKIKGKKKINGKKLFRRKCSSCHAKDSIAVGPSLKEIRGIYHENPQGIVAWTKNPGKKRKDFMQMPSFSSLNDKKLEAIAKYILEFKME